MKHSLSCLIYYMCNVHLLVTLGSKRYRNNEELFPHTNHEKIGATAKIISTKLGLAGRAFPPLRSLLVFFVLAPMLVRPLVPSPTQIRACASRLMLGHLMVGFSFKINSMGKGKKENKKGITKS